MEIVFEKKTENKQWAIKKSWKHANSVKERKEVNQVMEDKI